jgi:hypothetical protein
MSGFKTPKKPDLKEVKIFFKQLQTKLSKLSKLLIALNLI